MCEHKNCSVIIHQSMPASFQVVDGCVGMASDGDAEPTGRIDFHCWDCGYMATYRWDRVPKWLAAYLRSSDEISANYRH